MPLVSAERLHRWKCAFCGSKEKNISHIKMNTGLVPVLPECECKCCKPAPVLETYDAVKIVACSRCGHVEFFAHSAIAMAGAITHTNVTLEQSEDYVRKFQHWNFDDPMKNPHTAHDMTKQHNPGTVPPNNGK